MEENIPKNQHPAYSTLVLNIMGKFCFLLMKEIYQQDYVTNKNTTTTTTNVSKQCFWKLWNLYTYCEWMLIRYGPTSKILYVDSNFAGTVHCWVYYRNSWKHSFPGSLGRLSVIVMIDMIIWVLDDIVKTLTYSTMEMLYVHTWYVR